MVAFLIADKCIKVGVVLEDVACVDIGHAAHKFFERVEQVIADEAGHSRFVLRDVDSRFRLSVTAEYKIPPVS